MDFKNFNGSPDDYYHKVKKDPEWFYLHCKLGGFVFSVNDDKLTVSPAHVIDDEMANLIKTHKAEIIKFINSNALREQNNSKS